AEGDEAEQRGDLPAAMTAYRRLSASDVAAPAAQGLFRLGRVAWRQGRLDDALELYERARASAMELGDDDLRAAIENGVGSVYCQRGIFTQARASYAVASELAVSAALRGRVQINMGALSLLMGDVEEARASYERAVELLESISDEEALTLALHNLALAHAEEQDWDAAERSFERCLALAEKRGDRSVMAGAMLNQAELRCEAERYPDALERSERSLALFGELQDEAGRAAALRVQGEIYRKMHQLEEAEPRLKESIRIAGRLQLLTLEAEAARELGMVKAGRGDVTSATKWLRRALARFSLMSADGEMHAIEEQLQALKPWRPSGEQKTVKKG
ncbi:MAG: tetratricopeptide repeat protein, partial [Gemmatimonadaceae bacterium]|nr:tetratricopeptide repeat protein [Gemmatimonadaceae bacterium]